MEIWNHFSRKCIPKKVINKSFQSQCSIYYENQFREILFYLAFVNNILENNHFKNKALEMRLENQPHQWNLVKIRRIKLIFIVSINKQDF